VSTPVALACLSDPSAITLLQPLYEQLHAHQTAVAPQLWTLPARSAPESWRRRKARYEAWLKDEGGFVILSWLDSRPVGYALATVGLGFQGWSSAERVGDIRDLIVDGGWRNQGIGSALIDATADQFAILGVSDYRVSVIEANAAARAFYARRGLTPVSRVLLGRTA
jgi:GNAT superfamily N-acetyltransferase